MILSFSEYVLHYLYLILALGGSYCTGHFICSWFIPQNDRKESITHTFYKLFAGVNALPIAYAIFSTKLNTILLGALVIALFFLVNHKPRLSLFKRNVTKVLSLANTWKICLVALFFMLDSSYSLLLEPSNFILDYLFYSNTATVIDIEGIENAALNYISIENGDVAPYHYLDLWLISLASRIFNLPGLGASLTITYPLFLITAFIGGAGIVQEQINNTSLGKYKNWVIWLLPFSLFLCGLLRFSISGGASYLSYTVVHVLKEGMLLMYFILIFQRLLKKDYFSVSILIGVHTLVNSVSSPTLYLGGGVFIIVLLFSRYLTFKDAVKNAVPLILSFVYFILFYKVFNHSSSSISSDQKLEINAEWILNIFVFYGNTAFYILEKSIIYLLLAGYLIFKNKENTFVKVLGDPSVFWGLSLLFSGILCYALFRTFLLDSFQFMSAITTSGVAIFSLALFLKLLKTPVPVFQKFIIISGVLLLNLASHGPYSMRDFSRHLLAKPYIQDGKRTLVAHTTHQALKKVLAEAPDDIRIAYFDDFSRFTEVFKCNMSLQQPFPSLIQICPKYRINSLSVFNLAKESKFSETSYVQSVIKGDAFFQFVQQQKANGSFISIPQSQKSFILKYNISYLVLYKKLTLPPEIEEMAEHRYTIADSDYLLLSLY